MPMLLAEMSATGFINSTKGMVDSITPLITSLANAQNVMQAMENTLVTYSGSVIQARVDIAELTDIANKLGVSVQDSVIPFAKLAASTDSLTRSELFDVFTGFSTALAATHASSQKVQGTFLALQQIASKGVVSMQDLRRQLGEHIPGAMASAAESMDMSMDDFVSAVRRGTVDADELLINMGANLEAKFSAAAALAAESLKGQLERFKNAALGFKSSLVESSGAGEVWAETIGLVREEVLQNEVVIKNLAEATGNLSSGFKSLTEASIEFVEPAAEITNNVSKWGLFSLAAVGVDLLSIAFITATDELGLLDGKLGSSKKGLDLMSESVFNLKKHWAEAFPEETFTALDKIATKTEWQTKLTVILKEVQTEQAELRAKQAAKESSDLAKLNKKIDERNKIIISTTEEIFKATGALSENYYANERAELEAQSNAWVEMGYVAQSVADDYVIKAMADITGETERAKEEQKRLTEELKAEARAAEEASEANQTLADIMGTAVAEGAYEAANAINIATAQVEGLNQAIAEESTGGISESSASSGGLMVSDVAATVGVDFKSGKQGTLFSQDNSTKNITVNVDQSISRSDVQAIIDELEREANRS